MSNDNSADKGSRSVRRALDMLELLLAGDQPVPVAAVTSKLGIPKSTTYELVRTLVEGGYIYRDRETGRLSLGRKLYELGMAYKSRIDLLKEGGRIVEELRDFTGETVQLSVLENDMMVVVIKEDGIGRYASIAGSALVSLSTGRPPGGCSSRTCRTRPLPRSSGGRPGNPQLATRLRT